MRGPTPAWRRIGALMALLGAALALGCAAGDREPPASRAEATVFDAARLDDTARDFRAALSRAVSHADPTGVAPDRLHAAQVRVDAAMPADAVIAAARACFAQRTEPASERAALAFLRSPTGRRLRALERAAEAALADEEATDRMIDAHFAEPVDLERVALLRRLATAARADALAAGVDAAAERAVAKALVADPRRLEARLRAIDERRRGAAAAWRTRALVLLQLVYHDATDEELRAYAAFAESPGGRWLADVSLGLLDDLESWATEALARPAPDASPVAAPSP